MTSGMPEEIRVDFARRETTLRFGDSDEGDNVSFVIQPIEDSLDSGGELALQLVREGSGGSLADGDEAYKLVVSSGGEKEEHSGLTLRKGRSNLATKVNSASRLIEVEELT